MVYTKPIDYVFIFELMSEVRRPDRERLGVSTLTTTLYNPLSRAAGVAVWLWSTSTARARSGGCEGIAAARHLMCATQAPAHATGWMNASSAPTARAKAATLARVCV